MSEKEKSIASKVADTVPKMSEFQKGYLLGMVESIAADRQKGKDDGKSDEKI